MVANLSRRLDLPTGYPARVFIVGVDLIAMNESKISKCFASEVYSTMRMFLLWEDFQPQENRVDESHIQKLVKVCRTASSFGIWLMPALFQRWMSELISIQNGGRGEIIFAIPK